MMPPLIRPPTTVTTLTTTDKAMCLCTMTACQSVDECPLSISDAYSQVTNACHRAGCAVNKPVGSFIEKKLPIINDSPQEHAGNRTATKNLAMSA